MQSTNVRQIKAALVEQAFLGSTRVSCAIGPIVAVRKRKGQLLVLIRGWGRWYTVESVRIERMVLTCHDRHTLPPLPQGAGSHGIPLLAQLTPSPHVAPCLTQVGSQGEQRTVSGSKQE
jgi:hypothetical protein